MHHDLVLTNGRFTTNDPEQPAPEMVAITNGVFSAVGAADDVMAGCGPATRLVDLRGHRAIPGLIDSTAPGYVVVRTAGPYVLARVI